MPVVAAFRGYAIGGGCELQLQVDMRVASATAQFSRPEIDHGIITDGGGSVITAAVAGPSRAKYLLMTGERIDAAQAPAWGMVDFVVDDAAPDSRAPDISSQITARTPLHVALATQQLDGVHRDQFPPGIRAARLAKTPPTNT